MGKSVDFINSNETPLPPNAMSFESGASNTRQVTLKTKLVVNHSLYQQKRWQQLGARVGFRLDTKLS
ncbi:hypothetical protein Dimus_015478 [Dionaea muscipula]